MISRPGASPREEPEEERRDQERLTRCLRHGPVSVEPEQGIRQQEKGGDRPRESAADQHAEREQGHATQGGDDDERDASRRQRFRWPEACVRILVPFGRVEGPRHPQVRGAHRVADEVFRQGLEVEREVVEPGRIVDLAAKEEVRIEALGNVCIFVHEVVIEDPQGEHHQRQRRDRSAESQQRR